MNDQATDHSAWSPFKHAVFRNLWIAVTVSNIGTWMQTVGAAWFMTSLSPSPVLVALVQAAAILPMFLLALPAGALADIVDRRRLLLASQAWMTLAAAILGVLTYLGLTTPLLLLSLTFMLGLGAAMNGPAWQAIVPDLVPRPELPQAIALNAAGFNLSRAVGPAVGGVIVAAAGPGANFILNAISFIGVLVVLYRWRRATIPAALPAERMHAAIFTGLRYVRHAPRLREVLWRAGFFMVFSASILALLPLVARYQLQRGPFAFGVLLGCFGAGAVAGAAALPRMRRHLSGEALVVAATVVYAEMTVVLALAPVMGGVSVALFVAGFAWLVVFSTFNVAVQTAVPAWIRARAMAVYMLVFAGGLSYGSAVWGAVASHQGLRTALLYAAVGQVLGLLTLVRPRLRLDEIADLTPSLHWPQPHVAPEPKPEAGPVMVMVEYLIETQEADPFSQAMRALSVIRRRDGAIRWGLFQDTATPGRFLETFIVETWVEHKRQHERMTVADRSIEEKAVSFHKGGARPQVSHLIYAYGRHARGRRKLWRR
jgi:MFS family permease